MYPAVSGFAAGASASMCSFTSHAYSTTLGVPIVLVLGLVV
ncbi:hypothetical protein ABTX61_10440 [Amycolatopsis japonica]